MSADTITETPFQTHFTEQASKIETETTSEITRLVENIDGQGLSNFSTFESSRYQGLIVPYTKVSVDKLFANMPNVTVEDLSEKTPRQKATYIIFMGYEFPPSGHPFTAWDIVYDRAITSMGRVKKEDIEVIALGSPIGLGGKVTNEWVDNLYKDGFSAYGQIYSELILKMLKESDYTNAKFVFQGMSMGGPVADHTARQLPELQGNTRLLLDNPAGIHHSKATSILKGLQIPFGFATEGLVRLSTDPEVRKFFGKEPIFVDKLKSILTDRHIYTQESKEQLNLKKKALIINVINLIKGSELDTEGVRVYIRRGIKDPTAFSIDKFIANLKLLAENKNPVTSYFRNNKPNTKDRVLDFAIGSSHYINRFRIKRWERAIKSLHSGSPD